MDRPARPLSDATLARVARRGIRIPTYDRARTQTGVLHFGPGAFHRVHQACYLDDLLHADPRWGICAVSLQSARVRDSLEPQNGLYTLAVLDEQPQLRVLGSIRELLVAPESPSAIIQRLASNDIRVVTITVTEKGYCLDAHGHLDTQHSGIQHDLQNPDAPRTLIGFLSAGLRERRALGLAPPTILSCDNLTQNGRRLQGAVTEFCRMTNADDAAWIEAEVPFPCSMVDSITPATADILRVRVTEALGLEDRWPVQREAFSQWVIEQDARSSGPDWAAAGVQLTHDVASFERAKLRLLNGAHSSLAYLGSLAGYETVRDAMGDRALALFTRMLMEQDIAPTLAASAAIDLQAYIDTILRRFNNPAVSHRLAQIAWDGSQKLPFRLLGTLSDALKARAPIARLCVPLAAWFHFIRRKTLQAERIEDPLSDVLVSRARAGNGDARHDVALFLSLNEVFPEQLARDLRVARELERAYQQLGAVSGTASLESALRSYLSIPGSHNDSAGM